MSANPRAIAIANNDYVHIAWDFAAPIPGCVGFSIHRISKQDGKAEPLHVFGKDQPTTDESPISKYSWRDLLVQRGGTFRYRIIPMKAPNINMPGFDAVETEFVTVSEDCGDAKVFFNRGILATQSTAKLIADPNGNPSRDILEKAIANPNSELRQNLSGQMFAALTTLLDRAEKEGGSCHASLYELTDQALIDKLTSCRDLHLILSSNDLGDKKLGTFVFDGANKGAADKLQQTAKELIRRYMPEQHIGHNKFMVYVDKNGTAKAVLTGSTNWTASGMCTQNNNCIIIESQALATLYLAYWNDLKDDALATGTASVPAAPMKGIQGKILRTKDAVARTPLPLNGSSTVQVWYSPNTKSATPQTTPPIDMKEVYNILEGAKQSVLFLAFQPGAVGAKIANHFLKKLADISIQRPALFIRGAVSDEGLAKEFIDAINGSPANEDATVVSPAGILASIGDAEHKFMVEMFRFGHAIVHDKVIVVDPLSSDCVVITGSHNLGFHASSNNDENMLIIRGDRKIAAAYAAHVMDVVEHYRFRFFAANKSKSDALKAVGGNADELKKHPDIVRKHFNPAFHGQFIPTWQDRYFDPSKPAFAERLFWISGGVPLAALTS